MTYNNHITMTHVTAAMKKSFIAICTGTVATSAYAVATHTSMFPTLSLGAGALMGLGVFMVLHTQESQA